jgi:hypothetical protein
MSHAHPPQAERLVSAVERILEPPERIIARVAQAFATSSPSAVCRFTS